MEFSLKELKDLVGNDELPFEVGDKVFIRTVTYHLTGRVIRVKGKFIKLDNAAWIADSGRFCDALKNEIFDEIEPFPNCVWVNTDSISDFTYFTNLPASQK